jgi:tetratricopeptide (TPR) repeat protein
MWVQRGLDRLRRAVTVDPRCTEAWLQLANFWMARHKIDKQRQCLERILEYDPTNEDATRELQQLNSHTNAKKRR